MSTSNNQTGRLSPQSMLQQRYIIIGQVGRGGMGSVYQATDTRLANRHVAIKEMSQAHLNETELAGANLRFQQEASMLSTLSHPNLPRIYDAFSERGRSYLVMDFIDGKTLHQMLREANGQPLPLPQVLFYAQQLCSVLGYLHQHHPPIIFRDVKPTNVMVTNTGHIYLIDFGIARFFKEGQAQDTILLGSPGYAPPEQHGIAQTSPRSDIYGLGATLHYCLTGRDPYYADDHFSFAPARQYNPQVPVELDQLIQAMVAHDDRQRPTSMFDVQKVLQKLSQQAEEHTSAFTHSSIAAKSPQTAVPATPSTPPEMASTQYVIKPAAPEHAAPPQAPTVAIPANPPQKVGSPQAPARRPPMGVSFPSQIWTAGFIRLFIAIPIVAVVVSAFSLNFICPSAHITEAIFSLALAIVAISCGVAIGGFIPRSLMFGTAILILATSFAPIMQALPEITAISHSNTLGLTNPSANSCAYAIPAGFQIYDYLTTAGFIIVAVISLYWLTQRTSWTNRSVLLALCAVAVICTIVQSGFSDSDPSKYILLLVALIALMLDLLLTARIVRMGTTKLAIQA
jgi:serine/threonine protein kinase